MAEPRHHDPEGEKLLAQTATPIYDSVVKDVGEPPTFNTADLTEPDPER